MKKMKMVFYTTIMMVGILPLSVVEFKADEISDTFNIEGMGNVKIEKTTVNNNARSINTTSTDVVNDSHAQGKNGSGTAELKLTSNKKEVDFNSESTIIQNGKIIKMDANIFQTIGGMGTIAPLYEDLNTAVNGGNSTPISGAGYDGEYLDTVLKENKYFAEVIIGGAKGFMPIENVQIVPGSYLNGQTHYTVENGDWVLNEKIDLLEDSGYNKFIIEAAPSFAKEGVKYYSYDNENYTNDVDNTKNEKANSYFQYLPFRSSADYTASEYKQFLTDKNKTNSVYYNSTNSFVEGQTLEHINSLALFAMANHEGGYGTSTFSKKCNNFFGRGAKDSNPGLACIDFGFDTPRDGILAQAMFLNNEWIDINDWRNYGSHAGDKKSGINVKYASDVSWGSKMSGHMYLIDESLGGKELDKYTIGYVHAEKVYNGSNLKTTIKTVDVKNIQHHYEAGEKTKVPVILLGKSANSYKILLDTQKNLGDAGIYNMYRASKGEYPYYEGASEFSSNVNRGVASAFVDYERFKDQYGFVEESKVVEITGSGFKEPVDYDSNKAPTINVKNRILYQNSELNPRGGLVSAIDGNGDEITSKVIISHNVDMTKIGTYSIWFKVTGSNGKTTEVVASLEVISRKAPNIKANNRILYINSAFNPRLGLVSAIDTEGNDITSKVSIWHNVEMDKVGKYIIKFIVTDKYGIRSDLSVYLEVINKPGPTIIANSRKLFKNSHFDPKKGLVSAIDVDGNNITSKVGVWHNVDMSKEGTYIVKYIVTDKYGVKSTLHVQLFVV